MQSIDTSFAHDTYGEADVGQPSIQTESEPPTEHPVHYDALSNPTAEEREEPRDGELSDFVGGGGIASYDPGTPRSQTSPLSRMPSLNGSLNADNGSIHSEFSEIVFGDSELAGDAGLVFAPRTPEPEASPLSRMPSLNGSINADNGSIHSNVSELVFGDPEQLVFASNPPEPKAKTPPPEAKTPGPEAKTGDPKQDIPKLTKAELHDAIDEHYGTPIWKSDFRPHLTDNQHKVVQEQLKNIDEELGIREKLGSTTNKKSQVNNEKAPSIPDNLAKAVNKHYGTPKWESDVQPYVTADQHKAVQELVRNIDEELGIREKRTRSDDKLIQLGVGGRPFSHRPNKLVKKKPDYTEYHKLQATPMPELSDRARALKLLAAKKKAEGALMPKANAYADYYTSPKRLIRSAGNVIRSAKDTVKSLTGKKEDEPQNTDGPQNT